MEGRIMAKLRKALIITILIVLGSGIHYFKKTKDGCANEAEKVIEVILQTQDVSIDFDNFPSKH